MFQPFGGAVDIIVVKQEDGTYKSGPWYVKFGKIQGVLKRREKIVKIEVNGVEADFTMFMDSEGDAYFLNEEEGDDVEPVGQLEYRIETEAAVAAAQESPSIEGDLDQDDIGSKMSKSSSSPSLTLATQSEAPSKVSKGFLRAFSSVETHESRAIQNKAPKPLRLESENLTDPLLFMSPVTPPSPLVAIPSSSLKDSPRNQGESSSSIEMKSQIAAAIDSTATKLAEKSIAAFKEGVNHLSSENFPGPSSYEDRAYLSDSGLNLPLTESPNSSTPRNGQDLLETAIERENQWKTLIKRAAERLSEAPLTSQTAFEKAEALEREKAAKKGKWGWFGWRFNQSKQQIAHRPFNSIGESSSSAENAHGIHASGSFDENVKQESAESLLGGPVYPNEAQTSFLTPIGGKTGETIRFSGEISAEKAEILVDLIDAQWSSGRGSLGGSLRGSLRGSDGDLNVLDHKVEGKSDSDLHETVEEEVMETLRGVELKIQEKTTESGGESGEINPVEMEGDLGDDMETGDEKFTIIEGEHLEEIELEDGKEREKVEIGDFREETDTEEVKVVRKIEGELEKTIELLEEGSSAPGRDLGGNSSVLSQVQEEEVSGKLPDFFNEKRENLRETNESMGANSESGSESDFQDCEVHESIIIELKENNEEEKISEIKEEVQIPLDNDISNNDESVGEGSKSTEPNLGDLEEKITAVVTSQKEENLEESSEIFGEIRVQESESTVTSTIAESEEITEEKAEEEGEITLVELTQNVLAKEENIMMESLQTESERNEVDQSVLAEDSVGIVIEPNLKEEEICGEEKGKEGNLTAQASNVDSEMPDGTSTIEMFYSMADLANADVAEFGEVDEGNFQEPSHEIPQSLEPKPDLEPSSDFLPNPPPIPPRNPPLSPALNPSNSPPSPHSTPNSNLNSPSPSPSSVPPPIIPPSPNADIIVSIDQGNVLELSLCAHLLKEGMGKEAAKRVFEAHKVSRDRFQVSATSIMGSDRLAARLAGRYYRWIAVAPRLVGMIAFGEVVPPLDPRQLDGAIDIEGRGMIRGKRGKKQEETRGEMRVNGGWNLWPFGGPQRRALPSPHGGKLGNYGGENVPLMPPGMMLAAAGAALQNPLAQEILEGVRGMYGVGGERGGVWGRNRGRKLVRSVRPLGEQVGKLPLREGRNSVVLSCVSRMVGRQKVECSLYLWRHNARVVISDVDGTITKSDVLGQVMPLMGRDWTQLGVARLFSAIKENGYEVMFLSARSIAQAFLTRNFLLNIRQDGAALPEGPVVISPDGLFPSLYREVIKKVPHEFKISTLSEIKNLFPANRNPFYAGFGNRETDFISYEAMGIPKGKIFIINPKGEVTIHAMSDMKNYYSLTELVHDIFPSINTAEDPHPNREDFNNWNFWKVPLPDIDDDNELPDLQPSSSNAIVVKRIKL